jgi:hypothetical protein
LGAASFCLEIIMPEEINQPIQYQPPAHEGLVSDDSQKSVGKFRRGIESAILFAEVTPLNEAMRVAAGGAAIAAGADPIEVAAVYGGATLAIESGAAVAAASWLSTDRSKKTVQWFNDKLENRGISPEAKFNPVTKAGIAFMGGSAISSTVHYRENPKILEPALRNYGLKVSAVLAGTCAVQGYAIAKGIDAPSPATIGGAFVAVGSIFGIAGWSKRRVQREEIAQGLEINKDKRK